LPVLNLSVFSLTAVEGFALIKK